MNRLSRRYLHLEALIPFLSIRACGLVASAGCFCLFLKTYRHFTNQEPAGNAVLIAAMLAVGFVEASINYIQVRRMPLGASLYFALAKAQRSSKRVLVRLAKMLPAVVFYAGSVTALSLLILCSVLGWREPTLPEPVSHDLVTAGLTISVGIVAIFFTVLGLAIQRTMEDYGPSFLRLIVGNSVYMCFCLIALLTAVLDLCILVHGLNPVLNKASFVGSLYCVLSVPFLLLETFASLDISSALDKISKRTIRTAKRHIKPQPRIITASGGDVSPGFRVLVQIAVQKWITGRMEPPSALPLFDVSEKTTETLQEMVRPIINTCLKAIALDRREVVLKCLACLAEITDGYAKTRESYEGTTDYFLMFVSDQIEIIFNAALTSKNEQYTSDIADAVTRLANSTLRLTVRPEERFAENAFANIFCRLLATIALRSFPLEHSNAPVRSVRALGSIGNQLVGLQAYEPVLFGISESLKQIGVVTAAQSGPWAASVCQSTIEALVSILRTALHQMATTDWQFDIACDELCKRIEQILAAWYASRHTHIDNQTVIAPLIGGLWLRPNVADIFRELLHRPLKDRATESMLRDLERVVRLIGRLGTIAIRSNSSPQYEYCKSISELGYEAIDFALRSQDRVPKQSALGLIEKTMSAATALTSATFRTPEYFDLQNLYNLSPIWAFLIYFSRDSSREGFLQIYGKGVRDLLSLLENRISEAGSDEAGRIPAIYKYIKMFGAWVYRMHPTDEINALVLTTLARHYAARGRNDREGTGSIMASLGYPTEVIGGAWYIWPSDHWSHLQVGVTRELNDLSAYEAYADAITAQVS